MPQTEVLLFAEEDGSCPLLAWLDRLPGRAFDKCFAKVKRLADMGHELRRPDADLLRDDIYELRARLGHVHYRLLYFFHEGQAVISHSCTKEDVVPETEINLAVKRRARFVKNPEKHTHTRNDHGQEGKD
jgi:phage-related protein